MGMVGQPESEAADGGLLQAKRYSTRYSRVVTQRSTDLAQSSLPSAIGRERGYSGWYDRSMSTLQLHSCIGYTKALEGIDSFSSTLLARCKGPVQHTPTCTAGAVRYCLHRMVVGLRACPDASRLLVHSGRHDMQVQGSPCAAEVLQGMHAHQ